MSRSVAVRATAAHRGHAQRLARVEIRSLFG